MVAIDHEAHTTPLADRLVEQAIRDWLHTRYDLAMASAPDDATKAGVDHLMHGHLASYWYSLVPQITDELRRAGVTT